jgi:hypothetical protein
VLVLPRRQLWAKHHIKAASKMDPIFSMGNDTMRPAYNFGPKCRVDILTREKWTKGPGSPPVVRIE